MSSATNSFTKTLLTGITAGLLAGCATAPPDQTAPPTKPVATATGSFAKDGFHAELDKDGRLWVFTDPSKELDEFNAKGKPAKHVVRPGAGPGGVTVRAVDSETITAYLVAKPGFHTELDKDGRLWVFVNPSKELDEFNAKGKPAKHVVRPGAGPMGLTLKAVDFAVLDAYQAAR